MFRAALTIAILMPSFAVADTVVATRSIRAQSIIAASDIALKDMSIADGVSDPEILIGQEARVMLYAGRPIRLSDIGPPAIIERNQFVPLIYERNGLIIQTNGRALSRASAGEFIRVMNLASHTMVSGRVSDDGEVWVSPQEK